MFSLVKMLALLTLAGAATSSLFRCSGPWCLDFTDLQFYSCCFYCICSSETKPANAQKVSGRSGPGGGGGAAGGGGGKKGGRKEDSHWSSRLQKVGVGGGGLTDAYLVRQVFCVVLISGGICFRGTFPGTIKIFGCTF